MRSTALLLGLLAALGTPMGAQDAPVLRGTLRDSIGRPLARVEVSHGDVRALTDEDGNFRLTPVPMGRIIVRFTKDKRVIGDLEANVTADTTPTVQVDVVSENVEPRTLFGNVVDSSGTPIRRVTVEVITGLVETTTDSLGRFTIRGLPARRHLIRVRRVGFAPTYVAVDLTDNTAKRARIVMRQFAGQNLGLVVVRATMVAPRLRGFVSRAEKKSGWGKFITAQDIELRSPLRTSDLFYAIAGVRVLTQRRGTGTLTGRGGCLLALFINGMYTPQQSGVGIDDMVNTLDLAGIEIYNGIGGVPPELSTGPPNSCGTIGVWTK